MCVCICYRYIGQNRVLRTLLFNNNPMASSFSIQMVDEAKADQEPEDGAEPDDTPLEVVASPAEVGLDCFFFLLWI